MASSSLCLARWRQLREKGRPLLVGVAIACPMEERRHMSLIARLFAWRSVPHSPAEVISAPASPSGVFQAWFAGKEFSADYTSGHFPTWSTILYPLQNVAPKVLEIGSYEGYSALFFLNFFPGSSIVCIDPWDTESQIPALTEHVPGATQQYPFAEGRFDRNLSDFSDRLTKIKALSADALSELGIKGERFDLIYVDGSHRRLDAYRDCTLSWPLLRSGGILLIDDYEFGKRLPNKLKPKQGVDGFLANSAGAYDELHRAYQIAVRKR
jgi:Methyltransferase domain